MTPARKLSFGYVRHGAPETLLNFLLRRFRYHTADEWRDRIASAAVTVNGSPSQADWVLTTKERITYVPPAVPEPPVDARFTVLYEDPQLIAVSKSANIPTSPSGKYWYNCLRHVLQSELNLRELHAVHRLDRDTSGVNLFAKTRDAAAKLGASFAAGRVEKHYTAILRGALPAREVLVTAPLRDEGGEILIKQAIHPEGRPSVTRFLLRARLQDASLVSVLPITGRTHQIRAHAAFIGTPVWGDKLYGVSTQAFLAWVRTADRYTAGGHCLHASRLVFIHPEDGGRVEVRSNEREVVDRWRG